MAFKNKSMTIGAAIFCLGTLVPAVTGAYAISPMEIYRQARQQNEVFLQKLSRYRNAFDMQDKDGNTAYCIALRYNDVSAQEILEKYGADTGHSCVESIGREKAEKARRAERNAAAKRRRFRSSEGVFADSGNNYLWWGLGALAVGGGVAALAGGGGSGSSGEIHGPSGTYGKVYLGTGEPSGSLTKVDANEFRTAEYNRSNFLEGINAAEAYSYMYSKDDRGLLYSHQANSDEALKKVKVGVIDTGVFHNRDLDGKIVGSYDFNSYNTAGDVRGKIAGNMHYYIFSKDGSYYFLQVDTSDMSATVGNGKRGPALTPSELDNILAQVGLTQGDFEVMNGGGGSNPGTSLMGKFDPNDINTWWEVATNLSHGTHVAGIIAGNKNDMGSHGVAFENGEIVAASWDMGTDISATVKDMVDKGVEVFNNSWGYNAVDGWNAGNAEELANTSDAEAYAYAAKNGAVWVQATGNDGYHDAAIHAGLGNVDLSQYGYDGPGEYEAPFLAVAALDYSTKDASAPSGYLAGYSNWCGSASGYCLAAPGTDVESTGAVTEGFMDESGTSMATPAVAGSVALLMGYYPWLSAQNVAYILLETANDQGEYADSAKYGQGALDLEAAVTTPIDGLRLASSSSFNSLTPVGISKLSLSSSMQNKILKALPKTVTAFDALNRPFEYSTENLVNTTHASNANLRNAVSRLAMGVSHEIIDECVSVPYDISTEDNIARLAEIKNKIFGAREVKFVMFGYPVYQTRIATEFAWAFQKMEDEGNCFGVNFIMPSYRPSQNEYDRYFSYDNLNGIAADIIIGNCMAHPYRVKGQPRFDIGLGTYPEAYKRILPLSLVYSYPNVAAELAGTDIKTAAVLKILRAIQHRTYGYEHPQKTDRQISYNVMQTRRLLLERGLVSRELLRCGYRLPREEYLRRLASCR